MFIVDQFSLVFWKKQHILSMISSRAAAARPNGARMTAAYMERFGGAWYLLRSSSLFVGKVSAAAAGIRHHPNRPDHN